MYRIRGGHKVAACIVAVASFIATSGTANAATQPSPITHYVVSCAGTSCPSTTVGTVNGTAQLSGIIGNQYSGSGSGGEVITLTRNECYIFFCWTDYEAHLAVNWTWNVRSYGGVVYNVGYLMWADHLKPTFTTDTPALSEYYFTYHNPITNTSSAYGGYAVNGVMNIHQCVPVCIQTETVLAYFHADEDGSWVADINHS